MKGFIVAWMVGRCFAMILNLQNKLTVAMQLRGDLGANL